MKRHLNYFFFILIAMTWISCEEEADIIIPAEEPKIVINSFISPQDTVIEVFLSWTKPFYNGTTKNTQWIDSALVIISTDNRADTIPYDDTLKYYHIPATQFPILPDKTYTLTVKTKEGLIASGSCTVPLRKNIDFDYVIDSTVTNRVKKYTVTINTHLPDQDKYYIRAGGDINICFDDNQCYTDFLLSDNNGIVESSGTNSPNEMTFYSADIPKESTGSFRLYLITTDIEYYKFHKGLEESYSFFTSGLFDHPFYPNSNINGGLGIFGAHNNLIIKGIPY
jgi:hypothetical protein